MRQSALQFITKNLKDSKIVIQNIIIAILLIIIAGGGVLFWQKIGGQKTDTVYGKKKDAGAGINPDIS